MSYGKVTAVVVVAAAAIVRQPASQPARQPDKQLLPPAVVVQTKT